ncbi:hypothetical protein TELCIR_09243 [Teladorsagia circumcincta]|uniref:Uncharacterized protein n=1 Tax=Teladorsagia circumcincta TaxID=45464 RepID=A0A2G9UGT3_TELCI|nr:hypothetical protein TELCIR_09243 [Teladorsagia circumcincta]
MILPSVIAVLSVVLLSPMVVFGQDDATVATTVVAQPVCSVNQLFNGQICTCAPGLTSEAFSFQDNAADWPPDKDQLGRSKMKPVSTNRGRKY